MTTFTCFANDIQRDLLDRQAFTFGHQLMGHPALTLENLGRVLPALPPQQVFYSSGLLKESDNFDRANIEPELAGNNARHIQQISHQLCL